MNKNNLNLIDFGTSKIRFSVFDFQLNEKFSNSKNVKKENDYSDHFFKLNSLVKKAEKEISSHIKDIVIMLEPSNLTCIDISLNKKLDEKIKVKKIFDLVVLELNQIIDFHYSKHKIIHIIIDKCSIDKIFYDELPLDLKDIDNLKVDFKVICFRKNIINDLKINFNKNNLNIIKTQCASYVKTLYYSQTIEIDNISFLEIGHERTTFLIYEKKKLKFIQTIPIGGFNITKDISKIFKTSIEEAEKIKKLFNKPDTKFSYDNIQNSHEISIREILNKKISLNLLKKVISYRVQEIIDLSFKQSDYIKYFKKKNNYDLFLIGEGSKIFTNNSFHLNDKFGFKNIKIYNETDTNICHTGSVYYSNTNQFPSINNKKIGIFEKFFNFFSK